MRLIKFTILFFVVFMTFGAFSQIKAQYPSVRVIDSDTVLIFSFEQGKKLSIINEDKKRLESLNKLLEKQSNQKDSIIHWQFDQLKNYNDIQVSYERILKEKQDLEILWDQERNILQKQVKLQSRRKWIAIAIGSITTGIMSYLYITK